MLSYLYKFAILLIFPILQQIIFKPHNLFEIFWGFWKNILLIFIIAVWAFLKYKSIKYSFYKDKIFFKTGILIKKNTIIMTKNITSIHVVKRFLASFFGCYKVFINVPSAKNKHEQIVLNFSYEELQDLKKFAFRYGNPKVIYKASNFKIVLLSLFWSNPITSFILAVPAIRRFSKILGEELSKKIYSTVDIRLTLVALGLPPFIASIAYVLLAMFLIAFFIQFFRYFGFKASVVKNNILVEKGLIRTDEKLIKKEKIVLFSVRQTLLMKFLKLCSVYVRTSSGTNSEDDIPILIAANCCDFVKFFPENLPINTFKNYSIKPKLSTLKNFLFLPLISLVALGLLVCKWQIEAWYSQTIVLFLRLLILFSVWWTLFRFFAYKHSGLSFNGKILTLCGFKKITFFSECIPISNIVHLEISQSFTQKLSKRCNLKISILSSGKMSFCCKHLPIKNVENFVEKVKNYKSNSLLK